MKTTVYRVRELSTVTAESLELAINEQARAGWSFDGIQFAMRDNSKRPSMAFILFSREEEVDENC